MALKDALPSAPSSSLVLGAGLTGLVIAMTYRIRVIKHHQDGSGRGASKRSAELTRGGTPAHLLEHIARVGDPDYICLSIAENKLTVGPLVEKLRELAATSAQFREVAGEKPQNQQQSRVPIATAITSSINRDLNVAGDSTDIDSADECGNATRTTATMPPPPPVVAALTRASAQAVAGARMTGEASPSATSSLSSAAPSSSRLSSMGYGEARGPLWVRREIAGMMGQRMFHRKDIDPNNVVVAAGATSVLRLLVVALTEEGQGCLIPGPYFPGFDKVLNIAGVRAWVANRDLGDGRGGVEGGLDDGISPRVLEVALRRARSSRVEIRVLLITSPHNPTGRLYSSKALLGAVAWGRERGLHIIVDEVYANCIHRPNASFRSVGSLLAADGAEGMGRDVHVLYGLSKDLGVAGWRVGVLYSENKEVVAMVSKMVHTSQASADTMDLVGRLFREPGFLDEYFRQHQEGLRLAYMSLLNQLGRRGIMHYQAEAGLFAMLDLREFLENPSKEAEERLWRQILERTKVNLTPGGAFHCVEPGWFRLCFAYQQIDVVSRAVDRIASFLEALVKERAAKTKALEKQPQLQLQQGQEQRHLRQRWFGQASASAAAACSSAAEVLSAAVARWVSFTAGRTSGQEKEAEAAQRWPEQSRGNQTQDARVKPDGADLNAEEKTAGVSPGDHVGTTSLALEIPGSSHRLRRPVVDTVPW